MPAIPTPRAVFAMVVGRLPASLAAWIWNTTYIAAWVFLPYSVISMIRDLAIVANTVRRAIGQLGEHIPFLSEAVTKIYDNIQGFFGFWDFIAWPFDWFFKWLEIPFAAQIAELAPLPLLLLPSLFRYMSQRVHMLAESRASQDARRRASEAEADYQRRCAERDEQRRKAKATAEEQAASARGGSASSAAAAGIAIGAVVAGPIGAVIGGVIGAIAGAATADEVAPEHVPDAVDHRPRYWSEADRARERERQSLRRYAQAKSLLGASLASVALVGGLIAGNWAYASISNTAICDTKRTEPGEECYCSFPGPSGRTTRAPNGSGYLCMP